MNARGGGDDLSGRSLGGPASGLATIGVLLAGLGILVASPHSVAAQGTCTNAEDPVTPPVPATLTLDGTNPYTRGIACSGLNKGLKLDLNEAQIGTSAMPISAQALDIDAEGDGDNDVVVMGRITTSHSSNPGIDMTRDGAGWLKLELEKGSTITASGTAYGIKLEHKGKAGTVAEGDTKGISLVSAATIDVSQSTYVSKTGIYVRTRGAPASTTIPINIRLTGGSIRAEDTAANTHQKGRGVDVEHHARGDITITVDPGVMLGLEDKPIGAFGIAANIKPAGVGTIAITHRGEIYATHGIHAFMDSPTSGNNDDIAGNIVIETGADSKIVTHRIGESADTTHTASGAYPYGIQAYINGDARVGTVTITHRGMIDAAGIGIETYGNRDVTVTLEKGSRITAKERGIYASSNGSGTVTITHGGMIDAGEEGIFADGDQDDVMVTLKAGSRITAKEDGLIAQAGATGVVTVKTEAGSSIVADDHGIQVRHYSGTAEPDARQLHVAVYGTVTGGNACTNTNTGRNKCAGVYVRNRAQDADDPKLGGGTIVIGPWAHVKATSGVAIEVDGKVGDVAVILEQDEAGVVGHVKGQIFHPKGADRDPQDDEVRTPKHNADEGEVTIKLSGAKENLEPGDHVYRRGDRMGVYEQVFKAELKELAGKEGYRFVDDTTMDLRLYSHRARLYEVLPSVLLGLVDLTPYSTRMAVPRRSTGDEEVMVESSKGEHVAVPGSRTGVWVRLAVRDGERMADTSTTARDVWRQSLAWDVKQTDFEAGLEVPTDERLVLGVSAHYRQSEATVKNGGTMEASGTGVGVSLTWTDDSGLYVDGQLSYTRFFDVALTSSRQGVITSKGGGSGLALGVEVGQPMSIGGMAVTPRGGLSWSSVDLDAFGEPATIDGAGTVTPNKEQSVQGRVGVLAELGSGDADGRLYASLDLEHEFSSKHAVMAAGTRLATEVKPTWVRLGVGGAMSLGSGDTTLLTGDAFYATAGSDNTDFGGGLSVTFRF